MKRSRIARYGVPALAILLVVIAAGALHASGGAGGHGAAEGGHAAAVGSLSKEKLMDLLWRTTNFAGLVIILVSTLKKPIASGLKARQQGIREQFEDLEMRKSEAARILKEYEVKLATVEQEGKRILEAAQAQAEAERKRIVEEAERAAADIRRQAGMAVQYELEEAKKRLRADVAEQSVAMAEEIIRKSLNQDDQVKLVKDYLNKIGGLK